MTNSDKGYYFLFMSNTMFIIFKQSINKIKLVLENYLQNYLRNYNARELKIRLSWTNELPPSFRSLWTQMEWNDTPKYLCICRLHLSPHHLSMFFNALVPTLYKKHVATISNGGDNLNRHCKLYDYNKGPVMFFTLGRLQDVVGLKVKISVPPPLPFPIAPRIVLQTQHNGHAR